MSERNEERRCPGCGSETTGEYAGGTYYGCGSVQTTFRHKRTEICWERERDALRQRMAELEREVEVDERLLDERNRVLDAIPECAAHGGQCVPHALDWIACAKGHEARLEACERSRKRLSDRAYDAEAQRDVLAGVVRSFRRDHDVALERPGEEPNETCQCGICRVATRLLASTPKPATCKTCHGRGMICEHKGHVDANGYGHGSVSYRDCPDCGGLRTMNAATPDASLPTIEEMAGSCPDMTGRLRAEEYVRRMRGGATPDAERERRRDAVAKAAMAWWRAHVPPPGQPYSGKRDLEADAVMRKAIQSLAELDGGLNDA